LEHIPYVEPSYGSASFNCPHCNAFAHQTWPGIFYGQGFPIRNLAISFCSHCNDYSLWVHDKLIHPDQTGIQPPNPDLTKEVQEDYLEAASIVNKSPRGAAALLRLSIQKLCVTLGGSDKDINQDIKDLVSKGLPVPIQQALDAVRVIGNESVHPGQLDLKDDVEIACKLFSLVNVIANVMITQPKEIQQLYQTLPQSKIEAIKKRDNP